MAHRYPEQADFHNGLGALLFRTRRLDEARQEFEMARSLNPGHAYQRTLEIDPNLAAADVAIKNLLSSSNR